MVETVAILLEMTPHEAFEQLESDLGLTNGDLARVMDSSTRTIERWRMGQAYPQNVMRRRLAALVALHHHLLETFATAAASRTWLRQSSHYLGGLTPLEVLQAGRLDRVEAALESLDSGIFV